jgi:phage terminase large subunit
MPDQDAYLEIAAWFKALRETSNSAFMPLYFDEHRYLVLVWGGGSGKSIFAGRKILERVTSEPGHRYLVCRKVAKTLRESCFQQLKWQAREHYPDSGYKFSSSEMGISFANGSSILFAGLDDAEKLKSIYRITGIWIEEASELTESDFNQLDIRLRGESDYYKQIILTFNPVNILHWLKLRFFDRREVRARTHHSTYKDNRFLDMDAIATLEAFRDKDEYYYQVYCLGEWGTTGKSVFDTQAVSRRLAEKIQPVKRGCFAYAEAGNALRDIRWVEDNEGFVKIYKEAEAGRPYVIGGDTAGEGSDRFVAQVIDNITGEQVCTLRHQFDEDLYAKQVYCLGMYYNTALIGIEANWTTYPILTLERLRYPRQYVRERIDRYTHEVEQRFGFVTNIKTRPAIIAELIRAVREDIEIVCDTDTLEEMLTFVRNEQYKPAAEVGAHDDTVMALAIAHYIRPQQSYLLAAQAEAALHWTEDMWEDYENASAEEKAYLIGKWGRPKR